jgi:hypothetical protein
VKILKYGMKRKSLTPAAASSSWGSLAGGGDPAEIDIFLVAGIPIIG